jgi:fructosamine-3-kinase
MGTTGEDFWAALARSLAEEDITTRIGTPRDLAGGCIHGAARVPADHGELFVKHNEPGTAEAFAAEAEGLEALAGAGAVRVPRPLAHGVVAGRAYLVTEFVEMGGTGDGAAFGEALARMHATVAGAHGWQRDNWIGSTPQVNGWCDDWIRFWRTRRLEPQLALAEGDGRGRLAERGRRLAERVAALLDGHSPPASVLHGDLWAGNHGFDAQGRGCIFDPATYYGDRETDLAMTALFGGFPSGFRAAYEAAWPLPPGHEVRAELYNLYHVLNHAHLFGGGYVARAGRMIDELLAEAG